MSLLKILQKISITEAKQLVFSTPKSDTCHRPISPHSRKRFRIFKRDHFKCNCCLRSADFVQIEQVPSSSNICLGVYALIGKNKNKKLMFTIDHAIPISLGGSKRSKENLQTMCAACNSNKGNHIEEFKIVV